MRRTPLSDINSRVRKVAPVLLVLALACGGGGGGGGSSSPALPTIATFTATPASITSIVGPATLTWSVAGATSLSIDQGLGDVTALSSKVVAPFSTTTYTLTATGSGGFRTATTTVTVTPSAPSAALNMVAGHSYTTAHTLANGKAAVLGSTIDLFDPGTGSFSSGGGFLAAGRYNFASAVLPDGKILIAGGTFSNPMNRTAELWDPATGQSTDLGSMASGHFAGSATLLGSGKVLIVGGTKYMGANPTVTTAEAELYDPVSRTFTLTGSMAVPRRDHSAVLLPNGKVLIAGGLNQNTTPGTYLASLETYDPATGTFTTLGATLSAPRSSMGAAVLADGRILLAGGYTEAEPGARTTEFFHPATSQISAGPNMAGGRYAGVCVLTQNGRVMMAGGATFVGGFTRLSTVELFDPASNTWTSLAPMTTARITFCATRLANGRILLAGGDMAPGMTTAEIYP